MLIYLDMCSLQRPFDATDQPRVRAEAEAVLGIIALCEAGGAEILSSFALEYENDRNPFPPKRDQTSRALAIAARFIESSPEVERRALVYRQAGLKSLDETHPACAVEAGADYFCTCDDRLLKRSPTILAGSPKVVTPSELIEEIGP